MNPAVGIRPATAGDLDAVECVERRSFPEGEAFTRRQLRYLLTHAQGAYRTPPPATVRSSATFHC